MSTILSLKMAGTSPRMTVISERKYSCYIMAIIIIVFLRLAVHCVNVFKPFNISILYLKSQMAILGQGPDHSDSKNNEIYYKLQPANITVGDINQTTLETIAINDSSLGETSILVSLMHIPKTSITSFYTTIFNRFIRDNPRPRIKFVRKSPGKDEKCRSYLLKELSELPGPNRMGTFFREPKSHIYSQYLECKYDSWGQRKTKQTFFPREIAEDETSGYMPAFEKWLEHFYSYIRTDNNTSLRLPHGFYRKDWQIPARIYFKCYDPENMQTRQLFCQQGKWAHTTHWYDFYNGVGQSEYDMSAVESIIKDFWFIGIKEEFQASLCMFQYQVFGKFDRECDCKSKISQVPGMKHIGHGVKPHTIDNLNNRTHYLMEKLSTLDIVTYQIAKEEFSKRIDRIKNKTGVDLLCNRTI
uniref:Sulfotransferase domain-containing protein n=2 Tax=Aplanochytrium stocchinoi TaxID=215587 RepID=A0A7S3LHF3_9STRA